MTNGARDEQQPTPTLDIVIPVYNEGRNILKVLAALQASVSVTCRVLICYDFEEDDTLAAICNNWTGQLEIVFVRNARHGAHGAVLSGFVASIAPYIVVFPADDDYNPPILDKMVELASAGHDIVCACRFIAGGCMVNCPWLKNILARGTAFTLYYLAGVPARDPTNGFRLFSRRLIKQVRIESSSGFTYSLELLVKCHRLGWPMADVAARWFERTEGESRFRPLKWAGAYLQWYWYAFATTYLGRGPDTVPMLPIIGEPEPDMSFAKARDDLLV
jgi:glycosyltransferase involved in cell wall biosynthesis